MIKTWNSEYQTIIWLEVGTEVLVVGFKNDDRVDVKLSSLVPRKNEFTDIRWQDARIEADGLFIAIPATPECIEISWDIVRRLTDPEFASHMVALASRQAAHIGVRLRELRRLRGLTQVKVAGIAGIEQANLSRIENGHFDVSASTLWKLLAAMGYSAGDLAQPLSARVQPTEELLQPHNARDVGRGLFQAPDIFRVGAFKESRPWAQAVLGSRAQFGAEHTLEKSNFKPRFSLTNEPLNIVVVGWQKPPGNYLPAIEKLKHELHRKREIHITFVRMGHGAKSRMTEEDKIRNPKVVYLDHSKPKDAERYGRLRADVLFSMCHGSRSVEIAEEWLSREARPEQIFIERLGNASVDNVRRLLGSLRPWDHRVLAFDHYSARLLPTRTQMDVLIHFLGGGLRRFTFFRLEDSHLTRDGNRGEKSTRGIVLDKMPPIFAVLAHFGAVETLRVTRIRIGRQINAGAPTAETFAEVGLTCTDYAGNPMEATAYVGKGVRGVRALGSRYDRHTKLLEIEGLNGRRARFDLDTSTVYCLDEKNRSEIEFSLNRNPYETLLERVLEGSYLEDGIAVNVEVIKRMMEVLEDIRYGISTNDEVPPYPASSTKAGESPYLEEILDHLPVLYGK